MEKCLICGKDTLGKVRRVPMCYPCWEDAAVEKLEKSTGKTMDVLVKEWENKPSEE